MRNVERECGQGWILLPDLPRSAPARRNGRMTPKLAPCLATDACVWAAAAFTPSTPITPITQEKTS